jgi:hypothetical protein
MPPQNAGIAHAASSEEALSRIPAIPRHLKTGTSFAAPRQYADEWRHAGLVASAG